MAKKIKKTIPTSEQILAVLSDNDELLRGRGMRRIGLFGSFARNQGRARSDLNFMVEFEQPDRAGHGQAMSRETIILDVERAYL